MLYAATCMMSNRRTGNEERECSMGATHADRVQPSKSCGAGLQMLTQYNEEGESFFKSYCNQQRDMAA